MRALKTAWVAWLLLAGLPGQACEFGPGVRWVLNFAPLNPAAPGTPIAPVTDPTAPSQGSTRVARCAPGQPLVVAVRGELRLKHESREAYLPFTLEGLGAPLPRPGPQEASPLVIHGRIDPAAARSAPPGRYVGRFFLEIAP